MSSYVPLSSACGPREVATAAALDPSLVSLPCVACLRLLGDEGRCPDCALPLCERDDCRGFHGEECRLYHGRFRREEREEGDRLSAVAPLRLVMAQRHDKGKLPP